MFLNLTEETCTGTGDTLTLAGATDNSLAFGETGNAEDGRAYSCVVLDADGMTKASGLYVFDKTANTFTRNDSWNFNGTTVDKNPATNIALSGGIHTIRCDVSSSSGISPVIPKYHTGKIQAPEAVGTELTFGGFAANKAYFVPFEIRTPTVFTELNFRLVTAAAASFTRVGIYTMGPDGNPRRLVVDSGGEDTGTATGLYTSVIPSTELEIGVYFAVMLGSGAIDPVGSNKSDVCENLLGRASGNQAHYNVGMLTAALTYGALPVIAPAAVDDSGTYIPIVWLS